MTSHAASEPYTLHFMTTVERIEGRSVVLEETYFYPEGGGQPADRGTIDGVEVLGVQTDDGNVIHELAQAPSFRDGDFVSGSIDEDFRQYTMRAHTASHALYGAGRELFEDIGYGGFDISPKRVRLDFETATEIDDVTLVDLERLVNRIVWEDREVSWNTVPRDEALNREKVAYNAKTAEGITDDEQVRLVEIQDWDIAACGGTHVSSTGEIGPVTVLDRSNPGEGLTRVTFAVGPDAIQQRARERQGALTTARALGTTVEKLPDAVAALQEDRDELERERDGLRDRYVNAQMQDLIDNIVEHDGNRWLVGELDGVNANELADKAQELAGEQADVVVLVSIEGSSLAIGTDGAVDARDLIERATDVHGGGGGGSETVAQAGGFDASPADVLDLYP
jgi:alanyl-tRNA synthetase